MDFDQDSPIMCGDSTSTSSLHDYTSSSTLISDEESNISFLHSPGNTDSDNSCKTLDEFASHGYNPSHSLPVIHPHHYIPRPILSNVHHHPYPALNIAHHMKPPFSGTSGHDFQFSNKAIPPVNSFSKSYPNTLYTESTFYCPLCEKSHLSGKRSVKEIIKHMGVHFDIKCPLCNGSFDMFHLKPHMPRCLALNKVKNRCIICDKEINRKMTKHLLQHVQPFPCPFLRCSRMKSLTDINSHIEAHICKRDNEYFIRGETRGKSRRPRRRPRTRVSNKECNYDQNPRNADAFYRGAPVIYPAQQCNIKIDVTNNIQKEVSTRSIGPEVAPIKGPVRPRALESSTVGETARDVGGWEKHTKGIGSKLMNLMGYVPGQGLGPRGEGILKPLEPVVLPKRTNLDRIMNMREAGTLLGGSKRAKIPSEKLLQEKDIDEKILENTEHLKLLVESIELHKNYFEKLQKLIRESEIRLTNLSNPGNHQACVSPTEIIEISDNEDQDIGEVKEIGPQYLPGVGNMNTTSIIISSDDDI